MQSIDLTTFEAINKTAEDLISQNLTESEILKVWQALYLIIDADRVSQLIRTYNLNK